MATPHCEYLVVRGTEPRLNAPILFMLLDERHLMLDGFVEVIEPNAISRLVTQKDGGEIFLDICSTTVRHTVRHVLLIDTAVGIEDRGVNGLLGMRKIALEAALVFLRTRLPRHLSIEALVAMVYNDGRVEFHSMDSTSEVS